MNSDKAQRKKPELAT